MMNDQQQTPESDMQPRRRLGRGLSSLLGRGTQPDGDGRPLSTNSLGTIPVEGVERNPWQPRKDFDADGMRELADSIREHGVLQPILVRELPNGAFQLIAGERRWQAAQMAGLTEIPCRVVDVIDQTACELALEENLKRKDLNDLEKARAFKRYLDEFGASIEELGKQLSMSRPAVSNMLRLLELPEPVQMALHQGKITAGHARALLKLDDAGRLELCGRIQAEGLSVREVEALTKQRLAPSNEQPKDAEKVSPPTDGDQPGPGDVVPIDRPAKPQKTNHLLALEVQLIQQFGVNVEIELTATDCGRIVLPFSSRDEFESVVRKLHRGKAA